MRSMLSGNILYKYSVFYKHETFKRRPNDKRTINTKEKSLEIQTYLFIIREFKHNNNDFRKDWHNRNESNRAGKIQIKL